MKKTLKKIFFTIMDRLQDIRAAVKTWWYYRKYSPAEAKRLKAWHCGRRLTLSRSSIALIAGR